MGFNSGFKVLTYFRPDHVPG